MNEDTAKGTLDKLAGKVKETVGHLTGNEALENEGKLDQVKGSAQTTVGHVKDAGKQIGESIDKATD